MNKILMALIALVPTSGLTVFAKDGGAAPGGDKPKHERKTFDLLMATPLHPASILLGKLLASMSYVALILVAIVPLVSLSYIFGGVATLDMFQSFLMLLGFALAYGELAGLIAVAGRAVAARATRRRSAGNRGRAGSCRSRCRPAGRGSWPR